MIEGNRYMGMAFIFEGPSMVELLAKAEVMWWARHSALW